jgi:hypothetical protein
MPYKGMLMDDCDYKSLINSIYEDFKELISKKIKSRVLNILESGIPFYNRAYCVTINKGNLVKNYLFEKREGYNAPIEMHFIAFNEACKIIINELYKVSAECRFGYNNALCFELSYPSFSLIIFFKIND